MSTISVAVRDMIEFPKQMSQPLYNHCRSQDMSFENPMSPEPEAGQLFLEIATGCRPASKILRRPETTRPLHQSHLRSMSSAARRTVFSVLTVWKKRTCKVMGNGCAHNLCIHKLGLSMHIWKGTLCRIRPWFPFQHMRIPMCVYTYMHR